MATYEVGLVLTIGSHTSDVTLSFDTDATVSDLLQLLGQPDASDIGLIHLDAFVPPQRLLRRCGLLNGDECAISSQGSVPLAPERSDGGLALLQLDGAQAGRQIGLESAGVMLRRFDSGNRELVTAVLRSHSVNELAGDESLVWTRSTSTAALQAGAQVAVDDRSVGRDETLLTLGARLSVGAYNKDGITFRLVQVDADEVGATTGKTNYRPAHIELPLEPAPLENSAVSPPTQVDDFRTEALERISEAVAGGFLAVMLALFSGRTWIAIVYLLIQAVRMTILLRRLSRRVTAQQARRAGQEVTRDEQLADLLFAVEQEHRRAEAEHPATRDLVLAAVNRRAGLWNRRPEDAHFLTVALGAGIRRSPFALRFPEIPGGPEGAMLEEMQLHAEAVRDRASYPCVVDLRQNHLAILGSASDTAGAVQQLLLRSVIQHSPAHLSLLGLLPVAGPEFDEFEAWLKWLPHVRQPAVALTRKRIARGSSEVREVLRDLRRRLASVSMPDDLQSGWFVLAVIHEAADVDVSLVEECIELSRGRLRIVWWGTSKTRTPRLVDRSTTLSWEQELVQQMDSEGTPEVVTGPPRLVGTLPGWSHLTGDGTNDVYDASHIDVASDVPTRVSRALAPLLDERSETASGGIPTELSLLDLLEIPVADPGVVNQVIESRWSNRVAVDSLVATIGMGDSSTFELDFCKDGPHVLVAGTTGSGKSELLQTIVFSLAATYSPSEVNFLLVDFKGGAAFDEASASTRSWTGGVNEGLPHVIGTVDNLRPENVERLFLFLNRELTRRMEDMKGVAKSYPGYRKAGHDLPRLVVILDEFAALIETNGQYEKTMMSLAARGRSLGIHIVLATQRPSGIVNAQIRANVNARLCLRTLGPEDAEAVVDSTRPAFIPVDLRGRCYARLDAGPVLEFQTAWASAPLPVTVGPVTVSAFA